MNVRAHRLAGWMVLAAWIPCLHAADPQPAESPIDYFRQLLVMTEEQRALQLADRSEEQRAGLEAKVAEYTAMPATERELRLRATELRYYLLPMMKMSTTEQQTHLESVPEALRELVSARIEQWRMIPPPFQQQLIENQATLQLFSRMDPGRVGNADELVDDLRMARLMETEQDYERWQALSPDERARLIRGFNHFFQLTHVEKERTLRKLSSPEREAMAATLRKFESLPATKRRACVEGFQQFLMMPAHERAAFLQNADRWQAMSPEAREEWRFLVQQLSEIQMPPLPPGAQPLLVLETPPLPSRSETP